MATVLEVKNLSKIYNNSKKKQAFIALNNINLKIEIGEKVGYVGLNGAGKSTTIKILTGLISPTSGAVKVLGFSPFSDREKYVKNIGVVFGQRNQMFWDLRVKDSFEFNKSLYGLSEENYINNLKTFNDFLDLQSLMNSRVFTLSLGQRMRCNVALALLHSPKIVFLDEPTIGLDIIVKDQIRNLLNEINRKYNTTIIFTSHDMDDIENICDRILLLEKGNILEDMLISEFNIKYGGTKRIVLEYPPSFDIIEFEEFFFNDYALKLLDFNISREKRTINIVFKEKDISLIKLLERLYKSNLDPSNALIFSNNLEDSIKNIYTKVRGQEYV